MSEQIALPCPFCAATPQTGERRSSDESGEVYGYSFVECKNCSGTNGHPYCGVHGDSTEIVVGIWNSRAQPSVPVVEDTCPNCNSASCLKSCKYYDAELDSVPVAGELPPLKEWTPVMQSNGMAVMTPQKGGGWVERFASLARETQSLSDLRTAQEEIERLKHDAKWLLERMNNQANLRLISESRAERLESENSSLRQSHNLQVDTINAQAKMIEGLPSAQDLDTHAEEEQVRMATLESEPKGTHEI